MSDHVETLGGQQVLVCAADGPPLAGEREASDLVGEALSTGAEWVALPLERLEPAFLRLSSGLAGAVLQKFVNYRCCVAVVGDVGPAVESSESLAAFVRESNRGRTVWFVRDLAELEARLGG
ncbi:MAG TPA: DUF4180 domain-containing protein [Caulobacteraceae bacterium]|nr:DUF4180 domain-containing protein [Caulobacteraceae bacterium]